MRQNQNTCALRRTLILSAAFVACSVGWAFCAEPTAKEDPYAWKDLFDGKTLNGWKAPKFGGEGQVEVKGGAIVMSAGVAMTGVTWAGKPPRMNYEITYEGKRGPGGDFFATATFPVEKNCCSLVTGGWGGTVVGLSCVDFYDASDNPTTNFFDFKDGQWYRFRIRVTTAKIEAWIDKKKVVTQEISGHRFSIRDECDLCQPLGISTWCTEGSVRNIQLRQLKADEVAKIAAEKEEDN